MLLYNVFLFFFSSRRRHTRWPRDWSSDVCSSDLTEPGSGARRVSLFRFASHGLHSPSHARRARNPGTATTIVPPVVSTTLLEDPRRVKNRLPVPAWPTRDGPTCAPR